MTNKSSQSLRKKTCPIIGMRKRLFLLHQRLQMMLLYLNLILINPWNNKDVMQIINVAELSVYYGCLTFRALKRNYERLKA
ncbi:MAG: hypothetical protein RID53_13895 [Coleofasciculus sp. B1-GNL1-01]|uniref:hypothetical protein n=1 Tax=Coleofasciculus sp. B1-GNL1-01 TaxID=3068484 RepID=UPI003303EBB9